MQGAALQQQISIEYNTTNDVQQLTKAEFAMPNEIQIKMTSILFYYYAVDKQCK